MVLNTSIATSNKKLTQEKIFWLGEIFSSEYPVGVVMVGYSARTVRQTKTWVFWYATIEKNIPL
jgi:hypothetical protein